MIAVYLFGLVIIWTYPKDSLQFEVQTVEVCYGNTFSSYINLECGEGEVIQVRNTRAVAKRLSTGCPVELTTLNENTVPENCCVNEPEDCGVLYTGSVYQDYYKRCHGKQRCPSLQASWVDITDTTCNQTLYLPRTNYMVFTFSCIPKNFIKSPCEGIQTTNNSVYIWNSGYPAEMAPGGDSCTCAAEIDCNSTILIRTIDLRLQDDLSGTCQQEILVTDGDSQTHITCGSNNAFLETTLYASETDFITLEIRNTLAESGGNFWIEVYGEDEAAEITLSCGPSVIAQAEISDKTSCGLKTITTTTIITSTASTTTKDSAKSTTNLISTVTYSSTSVSTSSISTSTVTANVSTSTQIVSTITSNYTTESTTSSPSSTTNPDFNFTTSNSSITTVTSNSTVTSVVAHTNLTYTASSTTSDTNTSLTSTTDHRSSTSSSQLDTNTNAVGFVTDGQSSSPLGIIIAVVVVLLLLLIILAILLCKRRQIRQYFCPSEVGDKEDVEDSETAEYDTMPNPLLTEGTLPLITGTAAASTNFPTLPGGGLIGKKTTLEPINSPPIPKDGLNLSSSFHYKLPKIENIKSSIRREKSSIADELIEENTRNPFPNLRNFEVEQRGLDGTINETINEPNSGYGDTTKSNKDRKLRKKRKKMMDRLNRIKTPMQAKKESVKGFGSSTTRF